MPTAPVAPAGDATLSLPAQQREVFEKARASIADAYEKSPTADELMRLWLSGATPWQVMRYFEETILHLSHSELAGDDDDQILVNL